MIESIVSNRRAAEGTPLCRSQTGLTDATGPLTPEWNAEKHVQEGPHGHAIVHAFGSERWHTQIRDTNAEHRRGSRR